MAAKAAVADIGLYLEQNSGLKNYLQNWLQFSLKVRTTRACRGNHETSY